MTRKGHRYVDLITVHYDSAHLNKRMGAGPLYILKQGLLEKLQTEKYIVKHKRVRATKGFLTEIPTSFELLVKIKSCVASSLKKNHFPLILSGNCMAINGAIAGMNNTNVGVIWFDAHADLETPETTTSGFLDGMALSMLLGHCWNNRLSALRNKPLQGKQIVLIGARELSEYEQESILVSEINHITVSKIKEDLSSAINQSIRQLLEAGVELIYIHLDADVYDTSIALANSYAVKGGLSKQDVLQVLRLYSSNFPVVAAGIASFDPSYDHKGKMVESIIELIEMITKYSFSEQNMVMKKKLS